MSRPSTPNVDYNVFELLFIIGMVAWLAELLCEFLYTLPVFPTLLVAVLTIPLLTYFDYQRALNREFLSCVETERLPIPPEVFRWSLARPLWRKQILRSGLLLPLGWLPIFWFPAQLEISFSSVIGWICGLIALGSTTIFLSRSILYFQVAQWFDQMTPRIAGWFWNLMYRISDNHEFLPEKKVPEEEKVLL